MGREKIDIERRGNKFIVKFPADISQGRKHRERDDYYFFSYSLAGGFGETEMKK